MAGEKPKKAGCLLKFRDRDDAIEIAKNGGNGNKTISRIS